MAKFNPDVKEVNYEAKAFKPISDPHIDTSMETMLKGVGSIGGQAAGVAGTVFDTQAKEAATEQAQGLLNDEIAKRDSQLAAAGAPRANSANDTATDVSQMVDPMPNSQVSLLENKPPDNAPKGVQDGIDRAEKLRVATDRSQTAAQRSSYEAQMLALQKKLRSQYPGSIPTIDQNISRINGGDPANKLLAAKTAEVNAILSARNADRNKIWNILNDKDVMGDPAWQKHMSDWNAGKESDMSVLSWTAGVRQAEAKRVKDTQDLALYEAKAQATKTKAGDITANIATNTFSSALQSSMPSKYSVYGKTNAELAQTLQEAQAGNRPDIDPTTLRNIAMALDSAAGQAENAARVKMQEQYKRPDGTMSSAYADNPEAAESHLKTSRATFNNVIKSVTDGDTGTALRMVHSNADIVAGTVDWLYNKNPEAASVRALAAFHQIAPNGVSDVFKQTFPTANWGTIIPSMQISMLGQTNKDGAPAPPQAPVTFKQMTKMANDAGYTDPEFHQGNVEGMISHILNPKLPDAAKVNGISALFGPGNEDSIREYIKEDGSRQKVWDEMTTEAVTKEVKRLSVQKPELWTQYKTWAESEFGEHIFKREIQDLNETQHDSAIKYTWDTDKKELHISYKNFHNIDQMQGRIDPRILAERPGLMTAIATVQNLNPAFQNLSNMAKSGKETDVDAYIVKQLTNMGYRPDDQNAPAAFLRAVGGPNPTRKGSQ